jgi:hypothetical protein
LVRVIGSPAWARLITSRTTGSGVAGVGAHCRRCFGRAAGLHYHGSCCRSAKPDPGRAQSWGKLITESRSMADRRLGDTLARGDTALSTIEAARNDVKPAIDGAVRTAGSAPLRYDNSTALCGVITGRGPRSLNGQKQRYPRTIQIRFAALPPCIAELRKRKRRLRTDYGSTQRRPMLWYVWFRACPV